MNFYWFFDVYELGSISMQDMGSPRGHWLHFFYDSLMFMMILVGCFVLCMVFMCFYKFCNKVISYYFLNENLFLEVIWTMIPVVILVFFAYPSFHLLYQLDELYDPVISVKVLGYQWYWSYDFGDFDGLNFDSYQLKDEDLDFGSFRLLEVDRRLKLPVFSHIRVLVSGGDVLHSWAVPSLGVKMDAVPGRLNVFSLFIDRLGVFYGQCSELCGVHHSNMPIVVESVDVKEFFDWLKTL